MTQPPAEPVPLAYESLSEAQGRTKRIVASIRGHFRRWARPDFQFSRSVFLRLLGCIYLIAFLSLGSQIDGLVGSKGILPIAPYLEAVQQDYGAQAHLLLPTLLWFGASDHALHVLCIGGEILSVLLIAGILPIPVLILLWAFYLSLAVGGQTFLGFQWDCLLLEAGLLAVFLAPAQLALWRTSKRPPSFLVILLFRWLVFRVLFLSGVLKISSGDLTWRHFTALNYHYQTQPIPAWTSWYFHHLPAWFQAVSVGYMFYAELVASVLIFGPRISRVIAFWSIVLLQLLIASSGNFGFFNLLTIVLCFPILDDTCWPSRMRTPFAVCHPKPSVLWPLPLLAPLAILILILSGMTVADAFDGKINWPLFLTTLNDKVEPFRSINGYGLFRVMTTERDEIEVQGSDDGLEWKTYEFKWKPGPLDRAPAFCTPHMPRLDWQMWFASLGEAESNPWFINFLSRLLQGSQPVLDLLGQNPFPDHPPKYVRAEFYKYEFTTAAERAATGDWWKREKIGTYYPPVALNGN
jgi:hypothetical protein